MDLSLLDPELVYEDTILPDHVGESYRVHEGVARAMERWTEPYEELIAELERIVGSGDTLVSIHRVRNRRRIQGSSSMRPSRTCGASGTGGSFNSARIRSPRRPSKLPD